jgi:DNA mismatch repair protein MutL
VEDKITLLPDNIANQIAAGEVIQRPASAVKELLENAVDAGATQVKLFITDAGKALIQVVDNGMGMSISDARMCFERHATSKIRHIDDLFHIRTMGFRGEALASIAAVAQVELKTKRAVDEAGILIEVQNSMVQRQEPVAMEQGTSICMKNLFFNVPARRNFLKSNAAELRHIIDEFTRVALAFPTIFFSFTNNGQDLFYLEGGSLKQRIIQLLGTSYSSKLVTVKDDTDYMNISGFVGKPEIAKKTRGDQYLFVNNRFIKSAYLNHAVMSAYQEMIPVDSFPMYVLFIDLDPAVVDVNVHPTKQEIKFEDEKIVYAFVQASIKHALAQFSITPTLDFQLDATIQGLAAVQQPFTPEIQAATAGSSIYKAFTQKHQAHLIERSNDQSLPSWDNFFPRDPQAKVESPSPRQSTLHNVAETAACFQLLNNYIIVPTEGGFLLVHQQAAHERVIYDALEKITMGKPVACQRTAFPLTLDLSPADTALLSEILPELNHLGYEIEPFGKNAFVIQGTPADVESGNEKYVIDILLEQYKHFSADVKFSKREKILRSLARQRSIKAGTALSLAEMQELIVNLMQSPQSNMTPSGSPTYAEFTADQLEKIFSR